ncbi:MAG: hypothetical protein ACLUJV_02355 [Blautia producta]|nr:hypothetical protein [uncultured Blautia sp.]
MRKFLNLNEEENNIWTEEEMRELFEAEKKNGMHTDMDFEEWLEDLKDNSFEEIKEMP